ncbi:hypothetical protein [Streptomyces sp. NPDC058092]|uniref:hypothetical protein n=1 Tax=Streptomyces sp. NPDC058092 TaxID=3346336 RepID=UPI0036E7A1D6
MTHTDQIDSPAEIQKIGSTEWLANLPVDERMVHAEVLAKFGEQVINPSYEAALVHLKFAVSRVRELEETLKQIRHLHKDSPMGPCPVCFDGDDHAAGGDGLVPYPCPTARLAGAQECNPIPREARHG